LKKNPSINLKIKKMFLCIDTITELSGITLVGENILYKSINTHHASESVLKIIDELLNKAHATSKDLTGVFVIKGPGSFTGLRVGLAMANQFAHQLNIPITGLTTDEWWKWRTDKKDVMYLQSMNKAEVYTIEYKMKNSKYEIIPLDELLKNKSLKWMGQLSENHKKLLTSGFTEVRDLKKVEETWGVIAENIKISHTKKYDFVEPFYGKEPMITKSKKKLGL